MFLALAVLVSILTAVVIVTMQKWSNTASNDALFLARLDHEVSDRAAEQWKGISLNSADDENAAIERRDAEHAREILDYIRSKHPRDESFSRIKLLYSQFFAESDEVSRLLRAGNQQEARIASQRRVEPCRTLLDAALRRANRSLDAAADEASRIANAVTVLAVVFAMLCVGLIFRRYDADQNKMDRLAARQEVLRETKERFEALTRNSVDVGLIVDLDVIIKDVAPNVESVWRYDQQSLVGTPFANLLPPEGYEAFREHFLQAIAQPRVHVTMETPIRYGNGSWIDSEIVAVNLIDEPLIGGVVMACRDISERRQLQDQLVFQAFHDPLTKLPNRTLFVERLQQGLDRGRRGADTVGIIFLDLDNFKFVNTSLGHVAGDLLLMTIANRLQSCVLPGDTVARLGGDEFAIMLNSVDDTKILGVAERIAAVLNSPIDLGGSDVIMAASLGIAMSDGASSNADEMLRDADTAMQQAKTSGKGRTTVFDLSMNARAVDRLEMESGLRRAVDNEEFRVFYQPIVHLESGMMTEVEALVRWQHPTRGFLPPGVFIPLAEETGLIVPLGQWVLRSACKQVKVWQEEFSGMAPLTVSVNLAPRQLRERHLVEDIARTLEETGLDPCHLKLEITESGMMEDAENTITKLRAIQALGVRLAVDDFGTGYSSMAYLSSLPIDTLKIDRSFVVRMTQSPDDAAIVRAIVDLGKNLKLRITCEGIETTDQLERVSELGCDRVQGYLLGRPLSVDDTSSLIESSRMRLIPEQFDERAYAIADANGRQQAA